MAYRHITSCIPLGQQKSKVEVMIMYGVPAGMIGAIAGFFTLGGIIGALGGFGGTIPLAAVMGFCDWWFHYRLICIKDDQCAVGTVGLTAVSSGLTDPDLDFTINLVLAPVNKNSLLIASEQIPLLKSQHRYLELQPGGYPPLGGVDEINTVPEGSAIFAHGVDAGTTALHCEIEGNGMQTVCTAATVAGVVGAVGGAAVGASAGAASLAGCLAFGWFALLCLLIAVAVALLTSAATSAVITGLGWALGVVLGGDKGDPADVAAEPGSGTIEVGDHIAIIGDWIFDNAHTGWHELHPVKKLIRLRCPEGTKVTGVDPEEPHSERSKEAIEKNCLELLGKNVEKICELLAQGRDPNVLLWQADAAGQHLVNSYVG
ncbi:MAG: hypothetical protein WBL28_03690 [Methylotenera sp.]